MPFQTLEKFKFN